MDIIFLSRVVERPGRFCELTSPVIRSALIAVSIDLWLPPKVLILLWVRKRGS